MSRLFEFIALFRSNIKENSFHTASKRFAQAVRSHWGIENSLHWVLDVSFSEDANRTRKGHAPENYAILRHIALNILRKDTTSKKSIKLKRLRAGWDTDYLEQLLDVLQAA
jgi:hypothetical protein